MFLLLNFEYYLGESEPLGDLQGFENEWVEIEVQSPGEQSTSLPVFLSQTLPPSCPVVIQSGFIFVFNYYCFVAIFH